MKSTQQRIVFLMLVLGFMACILIVRIGYLQMVKSDHYNTLSKKNHTDFQYISPIRGFIYDRNGVLLAGNRPSYNLEVLPDGVSDIKDVIRRVELILPLSDFEKQDFLNRVKQSPGFEWQSLKLNLSEQELSNFSVRNHFFSGVRVNVSTRRFYPHKDAVAHLLGYVGRISLDDFKQNDKNDYLGINFIGRSGIESRYEDALRGSTGVSYFETDAHGRFIRELETTPPTPGLSLYLSVDIKLQNKSAELLQGKKGAIVALDPSSGEVLSFVSMPSYDPNAFVLGISEKDYSALQRDVRTPLLNRALYGQYAPGSTLKPFISLIAHQNNIDLEDKVFCPGWFRLPNHSHRYRCWRKDGHGWVDGHKALVESCDVYYYDVAQKLGIDKLSNGLLQFGFGSKTKIDLPGEGVGLVPSRDWKRRVKNEAWYPGETIITGIGQGAMLVTPLQLARAAALLGARDRVFAPRVLKAIEKPQTRERQDLPPTKASIHNLPAINQIISSMGDVVDDPKGTAYWSFRNVAYEAAGKTGTAQVISISQDEEYDADSIDERFHDHALFIGFAPAENPKIAVAVIVENGGSGGSVAAPIARQVMDFYLRSENMP